MRHDRHGPRSAGVIAALIACCLLVFLPSCASTRVDYEHAPRVVTVTEPDGRTYVAPAASMDIASLDRHAGEWCCADFNCPGDGWSQLVILGFYALGYAIYYIGYGVYWCFDAMVDACSDSENDEDAEP